MVRLACAYGRDPVEAVVLPTALFLHAGDGKTILRRIRRRSVNLAAMQAINQLSRDVVAAPVPVAELAARLAAAETISTYPSWANVAFAGLGAGLISQVMGGHWVDMPLAAVAGAMTFTVRQALRGTRLPGSLGDLTASMVAVLPALVAAQYRVFHAGAILVGGIMVLTPGLLFTTAVRDGIAGDLLSFAGRMLESLLIGASVAAGASFPLYVYLAFGGRWP